MSRSQCTDLIASGINVARIAFAGAIIGGCAVGLAAHAGADPGNCDPFYLSMTPQPVLSCAGPDVAPPPDAPPMPAPVDAVAVPPPPGPLLPPTDS
ncbi:MAG: hypothetical protein QOD58_25 [Mycobacterium sp.]|jgi:hypothetical protein|nr:hypothetical protein [Mycobacterium sp.]